MGGASVRREVSACMLPSLRPECGDGREARPSYEIILS